MSGVHPEMTPEQRRYKARKVRAMTEVGDNPKSLTEAADTHKISRSTAYRIIEELKTWEAEHTFEQEMADIDAQLRTLGQTWATCTKGRWLLCSGKLLLAYAKREFNPDESISVVRPVVTQVDSLLD